MSSQVALWHFKIRLRFTSENERQVAPVDATNLFLKARARYRRRFLLPSAMPTRLDRGRDGGSVEGTSAPETGSGPNGIARPEFRVSGGEGAVRVGRFGGRFGACGILALLCEERSELLRPLVEGPVSGVSPFSRGPGVRLSRFLRRGTKAGPSAPLGSPSSSLKCPVAATRAPQRAKMTKLEAKSRATGVLEDML